MLTYCGKNPFQTSASASALTPMLCQKIIDSIGIGIHNSQLLMLICNLISLLIPMLTYCGTKPFQTSLSASALMPMPCQKIIDSIGIGIHNSQLPMPISFPIPMLTYHRKNPFQTSVSASALMPMPWQKIIECIGIGIGIGIHIHDCRLQ